MESYSRVIFWSACTVLLLLSCTLSGCTSTQDQGTTTPATPASSAVPDVITIKNFAFNPETLTVRTGTTVTWVNQDEAIHQVDTDSGVPVTFTSPSLDKGSSYEFTFTQPGTYSYHCTIHTEMKGTIIVEP
jgi:plastocyanin